MTIAGVELVCPRCWGALEQQDEELKCVECTGCYPIVAGVPDLRLAPDPWIGLEEDRAKAREILAEAEGLDFEGHVRTYWRLTPATPADQAERFVRHVLRAAARSREWLEALGETANEEKGDPWLDAGCGTADLACAAPPGTAVISLDIAMRWLVIARLRLVEMGVPDHLVCANAEALPFREGAFSRMFSVGMFEHCPDLDALVREARRGLRDGGCYRVRTVNRYSLLPEPHVGLWGIGYLPRRWQDRYARWRSGLGYEHHHPWSAAALESAFRSAGFSAVSVRAAATLPSELVDAGAGLKLLAPMYEYARRIPLVRFGLSRIAPLLEIEAVAR